MLRLSLPGTTRGAPPVKGERSEGAAFTLDKGLQWESTAGKPLSLGSLPVRAYHMGRNATGKIEKPKLREKYCGVRLVEAQNNA